MLELFKEIWAEREHKSFIGGTEIHFDPSCFAHVLSRGAYPRFKLKKENIVLLTPQQHFKYDMETHEARKDPKFDKLFELADKLRLEYHLKHKVRKL